MNCCKKDSLPILVLGSTGSVGEQAMDVARKENITVDAVCAGKNYKRVEEQVREFGCRQCAMKDERAAAELKIRLADTNTRVYCGDDGINEMISESDGKVALNSIIGEAGLIPTLSALKRGMKVALANKESLVVAGETVLACAKEHNAEIIPVDSEHCAIYQCLRAGRKQDVKKLILTASGGPFFGMTREQLDNITVEDALAHPTWNMGAKITVDSASMMNKGFEIIEAAFLFDVSADNIDVVVHRESIIHSMVEYIDNSIIAQMSVPDMRFCVQYALSSPARNLAVINELDLTKISQITFQKPDTETFILLDCARKAFRLGGAMPAVLNAANEVAVSSFLSRKSGFTDIFDCVCGALEAFEGKADVHSLEGILEADKETREYACAYLSSLKK